MTELQNQDKASTSLTRRDFMKAAGVTAAGLMVSSTVAKSPAFAVAPARVIGANERINVAVIGVGGQGNAHIHMTRNQPADMNVRVAAVCDVYDRRLERAREGAELPASKAHRDYRRVIEDDEVDAVVIATPEHWHTQIALDAMDEGLHCYIEKPMCRTLEETEQLLEATHRTGCVVQIGAQGCSDAKWHTAAEQIRLGKIGPVVMSQGSYSRNSREGEWNYHIEPEADPNSNLDWDMWLGNSPKIPWNPEHYFRWRKWKAYSGGLLTDLFPHRLHPLMIATGLQYPTQVSCMGSIVAHPDRDVADTNLVTVKFPDNSQMLILGSSANEQGLQDMIRGHHATIYFGGGRVEIRPERPFSDEIDPEDVPVIGPGEDTSEHQRNWFRCIRSGETPNAHIELAARVQTVITLAEMSWNENRTMNFDPETRQVI